MTKGYAASVNAPWKWFAVGLACFPFFLSAETPEQNLWKIEDGPKVEAPAARSSTPVDKPQNQSRLFTIDEESEAPSKSNQQVDDEWETAGERPGDQAAPAAPEEGKSEREASPLIRFGQQQQQPQTPAGEAETKGGAPTQILPRSPRE